MELYVVRHAIAAERDPERWPDDRDRPLTPAGMVKFRAAARGLARLASDIEAVWSSPLRRAWQTAEILHVDAGWPAPRECAALEPDRPAAEIIRELAAAAHGAPVALVGHAPNLDELIALLLEGPRGQPRFALRKGGAACLDVEPRKPGDAGLLWFASPKLLRSLDV
jgi:phosphohistidine phosphatase